MTNIHDFIKILHDTIDVHFPNTERVILCGGDYIKDVVMELREGDNALKYSPYELFHNSENYVDTIERFINQWERLLEKK